MDYSYIKKRMALYAAIGIMMISMVGLFGRYESKASIMPCVMPNPCSK